MKYRKKPVVIEAFRFAGGGAEPGVPKEWIIKGHFTITNMGNELLIPTLEGVMIASKGDYVIKGVKGEYYPCKPDIFEMTYEEAE